MAAGFRYQQPVIAAETPVRVGMPGTSTTRLAGEVVEANPDWWGRLVQGLRGGGSQADDAIKGVSQGAKGANNAIGSALLKNGGKLAAGTGLLALLSAAGEFADEDDPVLRNAAQAAGNFTGGLSGTALGAGIGTAILPGLGTLAGGVVGGIAGSNGLSALAGGVYDLFTDESPAERARKDALANAAVRRQIAVKDAEASLPLMADQMQVLRADAFARAERDLAIQNEYNYANAANQMLLNGQQQSNLQALATTQYLLG